MAASSATSARRKTALPWPCAASIACATRAPPAPSTSLTTTLAPSSAKRWAMPSPNPEPAPVMIATLPASRIAASPRRCRLSAISYQLSAVGDKRPSHRSGARRSPSRRGCQTRMSRSRPRRGVPPAGAGKAAAGGAATGARRDAGSCPRVCSAARLAGVIMAGGRIGELMGYPLQMFRSARAKKGEWVSKRVGNSTLSDYNLIQKLTNNYFILVFQPAMLSLSKQETAEHISGGIFTSLE